jgi:glucan biosynthesis protein
VTTTSSTSDRVTEKLCLVKVYGSAYDDTIVSYWEPKTTTKSLASAVFKYYRQKFTVRPSTTLEDSFTFWTKLRNTGDNHRTGRVVEAHWEPMSRYFNREYATGTLKDEPCVDDEDTEVNANQPLVFKLRLGEPARCQKTQNNTLSRVDVLKQMFDAYINRLLAYNFRHTSV